VFYPIGFDDNGLPTERYVEQAYGVRAVDMPRAEFVALCLAETQRTAERYEDLWRRLGLSLDWSLRYSTIDARCQRTAQTSFVTLHEAGYLRRAQDPILWCPEDQTSLAQADVEDLERTSRLHTIRFGGERDLQIPNCCRPVWRCTTIPPTTATKDSARRGCRCSATRCRF
jgi:valyl-tRNA synthetase